MEGVDNIRTAPVNKMLHSLQHSMHASLNDGIRPQIEKKLLATVIILLLFTS